MAEIINAAQTHLEKHLPEDICAHIQVGAYKNDSLSILTDRAARLTWLRFEQQRLLSLLRQLPQFEGITKLNFKVRPLYKSRLALRQQRSMSESGAQALAECAESIEEGKLKQSLLKLAKRHQSAKPED